MIEGDRPTTILFEALQINHSGGDLVDTNISCHEHSWSVKIKTTFFGSNKDCM